MPLKLATYDHTGPVDYMQTFNAAVDSFTALTVGGGASASPGSLPFYPQLERPLYHWQVIGS